MIKMINVYCVMFVDVCEFFVEIFYNVVVGVLFWGFIVIVVYWVLEVVS